MTPTDSDDLSPRANRKFLSPQVLSLLMQSYLSVHKDASFSIFNEAIVGENALLVSKHSSI